jgi:Zn-dependent protease with chaperone function
MKSLLKPLAIVLAVPVLVTALGLLGRSDWESRWGSMIVKQLTMQGVRPDARLLARYSLANVCTDRRIGARFLPCRTYNLFSAVIGASALVGGLGLVFLGGLVALGRVCGANRRWRARLFRPSLTFAAVGTACLGLAHGLLAIAAVVVGAIDVFGEPIERVSGSLVMVAGTAGVVWALAMVGVAFSLIRRPTISVVGQALDLATEPRLVDVVRQLADAVGAKAPAHIVVCLAPWLFVTEMKVACLDGRLSGRTLCLSLPLLRILSVDEFRAQLAHELAHYSGGEEAVAVGVVPALSGVSRAMRDLGGRARGIRAAAVAPPVMLMSAFVEAAGGEADLGGERERAADALAAKVVGREALGSGLVKLAAFGPAWQIVAAMMRHAASWSTQYLNASAVFQEIAASNAGDDRLDGAGAAAQPHPTDRHPALSDRLAALGLDIRDVATAALVTTPPLPAVSLVEGYEAIEQRLSTAEHQMIVETGGEIPAA